MFVLEVCLFLLSLHPRLAEPTLSACLTSSARNSTRLLPAWQGGQLRASLPGPRDFTLSRFRQEVRDTSFQCVIQSASREPFSNPKCRHRRRVWPPALRPVLWRVGNRMLLLNPSLSASAPACSRNGNPAVRIPRKRPLPPGAAMHVQQTESPNPIPCDSVVKKY
jgi:hypothetical protein